MTYINRKMTDQLRHTLARGKSILLLGARQTGKTTLIEHALKPDISYTFIQPNVRQRFEKNPSLLGQEIEAEIARQHLTSPTIMIDEIQKIPVMLDVVQDLIDRKIAQFILTGSSARKLKHGSSINLLPGRIVLERLDPLAIAELPTPLPPIQDLLLYGSLPGIFLDDSKEDKNTDLESYVTTYLEEEVRAEALVRNVAHFAKFLSLAAIESGKLMNFSKLSQEIGISHTTIAAYFQILQDCLIIEEITPLTKTTSGKRLSKASKFLFFDLGIRRLSAAEGVHLPVSILSQLFEQFVGLELIRNARFVQHKPMIRYWRDHAGPEVDYVIESENQYIPIEVKWSETPTTKDCRHLLLFMEEYQNTSHAYIICQTPRRFMLDKKITVIPWQEIPEVFHE